MLGKTLAVVSILSLSVSVLAGKPNKSDGIQWFDGNMVKALEVAKSSKKPLFVYWGASWCPPCNVVKTNIFPNKQFVEATKSYISVYLDGDNEDAQTWGEKLKASGYPTLMVLNPEGKEVVRLSSSSTAADLSEALAAVHQNLSSVKEVVARVQAAKIGEKTASKSLLADIKTLSSYSWYGLKKNYKDIAWSEVFLQAADRLPASMAREKRQLFFKSLVAKLETSEKDGKYEVSKEWVA